MSQGYILIGLGIEYINEASMLAATIKKQGDNRPVSILVYNKDIEYAHSKGTFADVIDFVPKSDFWNHCNTTFEKHGTYPKTHLHHYALYDENIFLDSDVLCQYNTDTLWNKLTNKQVPVTMMGQYDDASWHWGKICEISHNVGKHIPHIHGGFLYFKKGTFADNFFDACEMLAYNYDSYGCMRWYKNSIPDEMLFALSHANFDMRPSEFDHMPIMTFNYTPDMDMPSKLQTHNNKILEDYIPFIHMYNRTNHLAIFNKIMVRN